MAPVPQLDHYYGRPVEAIETEEDGGWFITLEGGVRIINLNPDYEVPDDSMVGTKLSRSDFDKSMTKLWFGTDDNPFRTVMMLDPMTYQVSDPNFNQGERISPQAVREAELAEPFQQSAPGDREVDGPSEEALAEEKRQRAAQEGAQAHAASGEDEEA